MNSGRKELLLKEIKKYTEQDVAVAFSGGADSSLLLKTACDAAKEHGTTVYAITAQTRLHPKGDLDIAARVAKETGAVHKVIYIDELKETGIEYNPLDRCYLCKKGIFQKIRHLANELGVSVILEGTNADDLKEYRPGILAITELGIISPLADCGLGKPEIRHLASELGISVAERPASPCLATRLPYGTRITYELLEKIEKAEIYMRDLGFYNVRVRVHDQIVRMEVDEEEFLKLLQNREEIISHLKMLGFLYITLDLEGFRSGSMDISIL